eukprot:1817084-Rhodomonas_salina.1
MSWTISAELGALRAEDARSPEIQYKKPQFPLNLYQACGFFDDAVEDEEDEDAVEVVELRLSASVTLRVTQSPS